MVIHHEQRLFVAKHYFRNEQYALFQEALPNDMGPNKTTIYRIIMKFEEPGCMCHRKHNHCCTVLNDDTLEDVRFNLLQSPFKSL
jgi:hypothetical protein